MYEVRADHERKRVVARLWGFFSAEEVAAFALDQQRAAASLDCPSGAFDLLIEAPGAIVQSQDIVSAFGQIATSATLKSRRIAFYSDSSLQRLQLRRILGSDRARIFSNEREAERWLRS